MCDVQLPEPVDAPVDALWRAAVAVTSTWLHRVTAEAARRGGVAPDAFAGELEQVADDGADAVLDALAVLLTTDVDDQRTNPLSIYRAATGPANELLARRGAVPPPDDGFAGEAFPGDPYRLGPAAWSDIDPAMHEPGIAWGAWKAMTVLRRRSEEDRR